MASDFASFFKRNLMEPRTDSGLEMEGSDSDLKTLPPKRSKFDELQLQVIFRFEEAPEDDAAFATADEFKSQTSSVCVVELKEFKHRLKFFGYELGGKLLNVRHDESIEILKLKPETVSQFLKLLSSHEGQAAVFKKIDNLVTAFLFATAIEDSVFQQKLIFRIYDVVHGHYETHNREKLYNKLLEMMEWAWSRQTEGRIELRPVFTMCFAYLSTFEELGTEAQDETRKGKKKRKREGERMSEAVPRHGLNLKALKDLRARVGNNDWWTSELLPDFIERCLQLAEYNQEGERGWCNIPVARLLPDNVFCDLT